MRIVVDIDRFVAHGFDPKEAAELAARFKRQLANALSEPEAVRQLAGTRSGAQWPSIALPRPSREATGLDTARAIVKAMVPP